MTIDLSYNSIINYTNQVPIYMNQFTETPDPRNLYLNDNVQLMIKLENDYRKMNESLMI